MLPNLFAIKKIMQLKTSLALVVSAVFLTACGGGSDSVSNVPAASIAVPTKAEGYYAGSFSTTANPNGVFETIILENDDIWALYGERNSTGDTVVYGMVQGKGTSNNGSFSGSDLRDYYSSGQVFSGNISASYVPGVSIKGNFISSNQTAPFTATSPTNTNYNYNEAPKLADIVGSWTAFNYKGGTETATINSDGTFSSVDSGCLTTGTVTPRASGKNIFDLSLRAAQSPACGTSAGLTATGHVVTNLLSNGRRQLIALAVTPARNSAFGFLAVR